ncbi:MAG: DUF58 domain-containing protein [Salibacteraceae bacterium]
MPINHLQAQRYGRLELLAKQAVEGFITGLHKSPYHGFSVEFAEHRAYNTGESTRHIDWKLYGRTDKMFVKRYEEETNLRCQIVVDHSGSMFFSGKENSINKLQFSLQSAASLMYLMRSQRDAVGLTMFSDKVDLHLPPKSSSTHHAALFNEMEAVYDSTSQNGASEIITTLHSMAERSSKRSLIVVFSDFMDTLFSQSGQQQKLFDALQHLRYNKHEVILFHVYDQSVEVELDLEDKPHTFVDLETGEKVKAMPNEVRDLYKQERARRIKEIKLVCAQHGIDWNGCDIAEGVHKVLDRFIAKRNRIT